MRLRVGYVREHFSSPLLQYAAQDGGNTFVLVECPSGTGQLIGKLENDEIDVAIALTDALIAGIAKGSKAYKLVGSFVSTPLNWAVITGQNTVFDSIHSLENTTLGISRHGSGSETMAYVMALKHFSEFKPGDQLKLRVNNDIHGLIKSVNDGSTSAFMWEWFTTKPFRDAGDVRFIGSVPTPWPSWLIAATTSLTHTSPAAVSNFLAQLSHYVARFGDDAAKQGPSVEYLKEIFGYPEADIKEWLETVQYPDNCAVIPTQVLTKTLRMLTETGFLTVPSSGEFTLADFVAGDGVLSD